MKKRHKSLGIIPQVAILFLVGILTTGVLAFVMERRLSNDTVTAQTETWAENIAEDARRSVTEYPAYMSLMSFWHERAGDMDIEYDADFSGGTKTKEKCRILTERHPGLQLRYVTEEQFAALPEEDQKLYAEIAYSWLITRVDEIKRAYGVDFLFCVASSEPYDEQFFLFSGANENAVRGTDYEEVYPLGHIVTVSESQQEAMRSARQRSSHLADAGNYVDYYSYLCSVNDDSVFIGMTYELSELRSAVDAKTLTGATYAIINQAMLSLLCLGLIYFFVLRPLRSVQKNIRLYRETKDSETVVKNLERVRPHNEIGTLSEDVCDLTKEMDDHLERIQSITAEKERIGAELSLATKLQAAFLPSVFPPFPERKEFDIYASMDPAKEVGGDFYDFYFIDDDHLCLTIADVSGKGIPGALFMMVSKIILQSCAMLGQSAGEVLTKTNEAICSNNKEGMFVTVWIGILEISTGRLTCANAGHEYPAIKRAGGAFELYKDKHGIVIGGMDGVKYKEYELTLTPGDKLFVYTDGVPEASDGEDNMFGMERMLDALNEEPEATPERILKNVRAAVDGFVSGAEQFDDLTMLCMEYYGGKGTV